MSWTCPVVRGMARAWSVLELSQLSMCTEWPRAATYRLVQCWNRSNLAPGSSREGHVMGKSGHASMCSGGSDDVISWRGRRRVIEVSCSGAWAWTVGADTHGHVLWSAIKTRAWRRPGRTDERGQMDREWVWWLEADSWWGSSSLSICDSVGPWWSEH